MQYPQTPLIRLMKAGSRKEVTMSNLHLDPVVQTVDSALVIPLLQQPSPEQARQWIGTLIIKIDAAIFLFQP